MKTFRMNNDVYKDVKIQRLRPELFKFWVNLLSARSEHGPIEDEESIGRLLYLSRPVVKRYCEDLEFVGLLVRSETEGLLANHRCFSGRMPPKEHRRSAEGTLKDRRRITEGATDAGAINENGYSASSCVEKVGVIFTENSTGKLTDSKKPKPESRENVSILLFPSLFPL